MIKKSSVDGGGKRTKLSLATAVAWRQSKCLWDYTVLDEEGKVNICAKINLV